MINEIGMRNFKCFENIVVPLKNVNILTGINGMGKSTVIQSLLLLRQSYLQNKNGLCLNGEYVNLGVGQDILFEKAKEEIIQISYSADNRTYNNTFSYILDSNFLPSINKFENDYKISLYSSKFIYLSAYRIAPRDLYHITNEDEIKNRKFGNDGEFALQYLNLMGDEEIRNKLAIIPDKLGNSLNNQTRAWMNMISHGVSPKVTINTSIRTSEVRYEFIEGRNKTNSYKSVNVGFGITYVLPIVIALLSAREEDLIIIENPEAHIHPTGQRKLGELIAIAGMGGAQIIVETHSDHILNGVRIAVKEKKVNSNSVNCMYFYKNEEADYKHEVILPKITDSGKLDQWPKGFFDEWDNALLELL